MEKTRLGRLRPTSFASQGKFCGLAQLGLVYRNTSVKLVRNMISQGNPSLVTYRIDTFLYHITCPHPGSIRVETVALRFVNDLIAISSSIAKRNGVLLMELMEKETCPSVICHMLSSSSVDVADEVFKKRMKSGNTLI